MGVMQQPIRRRHRRLNRAHTSPTHARHGAGSAHSVVCVWVYLCDGRLQVRLCVITATLFTATL